MTEEGGVELPDVGELAAALAEVERLREGLEDFDVAVVTQGVPARATIQTFQESGVTWNLVTGWIDELHDLAANGPLTG